MEDPQTLPYKANLELFVQFPDHVKAKQKEKGLRAQVGNCFPRAEALEALHDDDLAMETEGLEHELAVRLPQVLETKPGPRRQ